MSDLGKSYVRIPLLWDWSYETFFGHIQVDETGELSFVFSPEAYEKVGVQIFRLACDGVLKAVSLSTMEVVQQGDNVSISDIQHQTLLEHVRRETKAAGFSPEETAWYERMVTLCTKDSPFTDIPNEQISMVRRLLNRELLSDITDDPGEWFGLTANLWQNKRNPKVFSYDGGKTYHYLDHQPTDSKCSKEVTNVD